MDRNDRALRSCMQCNMAISTITRRVVKRMTEEYGRAEVVVKGGIQRG